MTAMDIFQKWVLLGEASVAHLPKYGDCPAVYVLRDSRNGDILKFGCTGCLRKRIFANYLSGFGGKELVSTTQRLHRELFVNNMIDHVELAWFETIDRAEANRKEGELRTAYRKANNGKRPVWDRNG